MHLDAAPTCAFAQRAHARSPNLRVGAWCGGGIGSQQGLPVQARHASEAGLAAVLKRIRCLADTLTTIASLPSESIGAGGRDGDDVSVNHPCLAIVTSQRALSLTRVSWHRHFARMTSDFAPAVVTVEG